MEQDNLQDLTDLTPDASVMLGDVLDGLAMEPKYIPSLYFYDQRGSELFDEICELPEYYPTRTEIAIMRAHAGEMAEALGPGVRLVELGSGSSVKVGHLLRNMPDLACYVPVEISREHLMAASERLAEEFPRIEILPVCADFTEPFDMPEPERADVIRDAVYFPGSTIGNFPQDMAADLLKLMSERMGQGLDRPAGMIIGVDLRKDPTILERAYNDEAGVTAAFNLNLLHRLNRELKTDFDPDAFEHRAVFDGEASRIEMHLVSLKAQTVRVRGREFRFEEGEPLVTEYSYKYTREAFARLAGDNGWRVEQVWTDAEELFSVQFLVADR